MKRKVSNVIRIFNNDWRAVTDRIEDDWNDVIFSRELEGFGKLSSCSFPENCNTFVAATTPMTLDFVQ